MYKCTCCREKTNDGTWSSDGEFFCDNCCDKLAAEWKVTQDDLQDK